MAEFLSSIVGPFTKYVMDPIVAKFRVLRHFGENIEALERPTNDLDARRKDEQGKLVDAKKQEGVEASAAANVWFHEVDKVVSDARNLKVEYELDQARGACHQCRPNCFCCCFSRYQLSKRASKLKQDVEKLYEQDLKSGWTAAPNSQKGGRSRELDIVSIEGQSTTEKLKGDIIKAVVDDSYVVVGLHGMGGVGKTTLIRHAYNHFRNTDDFNSVIFTTVSATPNFVEIRKEIARSLQLKVEKDEDDKDVKEKLSRLSSSMIGKYLLILDDMWESRVDIGEICIPAPSKKNGCKILMASRLGAVITRFVVRFAARDSLRSIPVNCLPAKEAWNLFVQKVGEEITCKPEIKPLAEEVVRKCDGLPLAIIVVGGTMGTRETEGEWKDAVRELEQSASNLEGIEEEVFSKLIFSFEKLQPIEQSLFLYCCLYPEDYPINREWGIFYFAIGEETLVWSDMQYKLGDVRNKIDVWIGKLQNSSMLEGAGSGSVKMHDVMRELAVWITSPTTTSSNKRHSTTKFIATAGGRISEAPPASEWSQANKISLMNNKQIESLPELPDSCPQLHTLLLRYCSGIKEIPQVHFLDHMPALRILDLTRTGIKNLPPSISNLVNLRLLCLSDCYFLEKLPPEIGMLLQLMWLDLDRCKCLRKLPVEMKKLKNLRHLDFEETRELKRIPRGLLSGLHKLEELRAGKLDMNGIRELSQLTRLAKSNIQVVEIKKDDIMEFCQLICLTKIQIWEIEIKKEKVSHWLKPLLLGDNYGIQKLSVRNCDIDPLALSDLLEDSSSRGKVSPIERVEFKSCEGLTRVPTHGCEWLVVQDCPDVKALLIMVDEEEVEIRTNINNNAFRSLKWLVLDRLHQLETMCIGIPQPGSTSFTNLRDIIILECPNLKVLFSKGVTRLLTKLGSLCVYRCSQLVKLGVLSDDDDIDDAFPSLEAIYLCELPELTAICDLDLKWPSLSTTHIYDCPKLRRPPFGAHRANISLNDEIDSLWTKHYLDEKKRQEEKGEEEKEEEEKGEVEEDDEDDDDEDRLMSS